MALQLGQSHLLIGLLLLLLLLMRLLLIGCVSCLRLLHGCGQELRLLEEQLLLSGQESSQLERDSKGQEGSQDQRKREGRGREKKKSSGKEKELQVQEAQEKKQTQIQQLHTVGSECLLSPTKSVFTFLNIYSLFPSLC